MKNREASDDINLLEIFYTIADNKKKIVLIVVLTIAIAFGLKISNENLDVNRTEFITKFEVNSMLNETYNYQDIILNIDSKSIILNRFTLFNLFTKILEVEMQQIIKNFNLIEIEDYENIKAYNLAIEKIRSSIIINTLNEDKEELYFGTITFSTTNQNISNKWIDFIDTIEYSINQKTQKYLQEIISNTLNKAKYNKRIALEDVENEIANALKNYEFEMKARLSFLKEQARIAREGNVESENVTTSSFGYNYSINYNEDALSLYYLKGYRVIEKEVELINKRKDPYLFAKGIQELEAKRSEIESNQNIERKEAKFKKTPIFNYKEVFLAGKVNSTSSKVRRTNRATSTSAIIVISILIGLIISTFYIIISNRFRNVVKRNRK